MSSVDSQQRVLSGMRPTGKLHLGHYHGVLKNWVKLQHEYECFFFVADWHALTTHYDDPSIMERSVWDMVIDWLAAGVNPGSATLFLQSKVPEHAELHLLLSMITPLGWLERVPTYKDQQEKLKEKDLATYGFLGYPLLQSADILLYRAGMVPVGADQVAHVEITREVARRFNYVFGREPGFEENAEAAIKKMGKKAAKLYSTLRKRYTEEGDGEALATAQALLKEQQNITLGDKERLMGYLEGGGKVILPEPQALLTPESKMPGLDGQKMSKSYGNTISLREEESEIERKIRTMRTDPARVRRDDPGNPENCPVWQLHEVYSDDDVKEWVQKGCRNAGIGCLDCKGPVIDAIKAEVAPIQERAKQYESNPDLVKSIIQEGSERAREAARDTMEDVRHAMGLAYR
ncbi:MAG: tryptophan--tRNA ligase [Gammaproteobacteria bacterium]|nr:tryptophan--tRNA ligase [Gammaproteobacteria bacterium]